MSRLFLGVDGGQSATIALIGDETGTVIGIGRSGPVNHVGAREGAERFRNALAGCVGTGLHSAGLALGTQFEAACFGFSGGPQDKESLTREIVPARLCSVTHDAMIALAGSAAGKPGVVVIAGTGSMGFGKNADGKTARAGGWGYTFGDEGGAFDIVRQALRASVRAFEGWAPRTALTDALLEATGASDPHDILHRFYTEEFPRPRVASLATTVDATACEGDQIAREILLGAARDLATLAGVVRTQLFQKGESVLATWTGGVFRSAMLLERFKMLVELEDGVTAAPPVFEPAAGALIEAYALAGLRPELKEVPREGSGGVESGK